MSVTISAACMPGHPARVRPTLPPSRFILGLVLAFLASGCAGPPPSPFGGADPSDPAVRGKPVGYRSTVAPYTPQRPVEPAPWREQNERVAPPSGSGRSE